MRDFYKKELPEYKAYRENINWDAEGEGSNYLLLMQTGISLESKYRKVIIYTKYYQHAFPKHWITEIDKRELVSAVCLFE